MSDGSIVPKSRTEIVQSAKQNFIDRLELEAEKTPSLFGDEIAMAILNAQSEEELSALLQIQGLPSSKNLVGIEHEVLEIALQKGNPEYEEGGFGYYWIVDAVNLESGTSMRYSAGGKSAVATFWKWREFGKIPGIEIVITAKPAAIGNTILLREVPKRATKGKVES